MKILKLNLQKLPKIKKRSEKERKKRLYSAKGYLAMQRSARENLHTPEIYATRDMSYQQTPEHREKQRQIALKVWTERKSEVILKRRPANYTGVLTEQEMVAM